MHVGEQEIHGAVGTRRAVERVIVLDHKQHVVAVVAGRLQVQDLQAMRTQATETALEQRRHRDLAREHQERVREGEQWER